MKAVILALMLAAGPAAAGPFSDLVMAPGVLADVPAGPVFRYAHMRHMPPREQGQELPGAERGQPMPEPVTDGLLTVTAEPGDGGMQLVLTRGEGGETRPVAAFPARGPNPVLLFFLENTMRVLAAETGGSPFYFRSRIREALGTAQLPDAGEPMVLRPFAEDKNRDRMGDLGTLTLTLTFDPAKPGRLIELKADTAAGAQGYTETLTLIAED